MRGRGQVRTDDWMRGKYGTARNHRVVLGHDFADVLFEVYHERKQCCAAVTAASLGYRRDHELELADEWDGLRVFNVGGGGIGRGTEEEIDVAEKVGWGIGDASGYGRCS
jgi:hypothetical protein